MGTTHSQKDHWVRDKEGCDNSSKGYKESICKKVLLQLHKPSKLSSPGKEGLLNSGAGTEEGSQMSSGNRLSSESQKWPQREMLLWILHITRGSLRDMKLGKLPCALLSIHRILFPVILENHPSLYGYKLTLYTVQFSRSIVSDSLLPQGLHTRLPCPLPTPGACSN